MNIKVLEVLLWSIALPGFGQLLNKNYVKGILFLLLEMLINLQSGFNKLIILSFHGNTHAALEQVNFQWLMFYPCLYFFAMWDAVKDAYEGEACSPLLFLPFVFIAYAVTVGLIYSPKITIFGYLAGPVFLPILFIIPGLIIGLVAKKLINRS